MCGYIIRDEVVVKGNQYKNGMEQIKSEGEKVAKNENVFRYYSKNEENLKKQIAELDNKIQETMQKQTGIREICPSLCWNICCCHFLNRLKFWE